MDSNKFGNMQMKLLDGAGFNDDVKAAVRKIFLRFAPDGKMTFNSFVNFLGSSGLVSDVSRVEQYFRAFDDRYQGHLSFTQFLSGLAALDPRTSHGGELGEARCRYIFRFYCHKHAIRGTMNDTDFRNLATDIVIAKQPSVAGKTGEIKRLAGPYFQHFELDFTMSKFIQKVGTLQLRGTSGLFRALRPVTEWLKNYSAQSSSIEPMDQSASASRSTTCAAIQTQPEFRASHSCVLITASGCVVESTEATGISNDVEMVPVVSDTASILSPKQRVADCKTDSIKCAVEILRGLDYFYWPYFLELPSNSYDKANRAGVGGNLSEGVHKPSLDWYDVKMVKLAASLVNLCQYVQPILAAEPRCLELRQPIYVFGDIHGNFEDLHAFERLFWPLGAQNSIANTLFLGDYVDRGDYGLEVVAYLFAMKILAPDKVYLLRGNHELREQQISHHFKEECIKKFANANGGAVWNAINDCFDCLPMAAIIDNQIFCVHGGIPHPRHLQRIPRIKPNDLASMINSLCSCPARRFETASAAWELMWNDPLCDDDPAPKLDVYGFRPNTRRGSGHEFSEKAVDAFLSKYGLSHIIRAHQVQSTATQICVSDKCFNVFSSTLHNGTPNEAAVAIVDNCTIKMVRITRQISESNAEKENDGARRANEAIDGMISGRQTSFLAKR